MGAGRGDLIQSVIALIRNPCAFKERCHLAQAVYPALPHQASDGNLYATTLRGGSCTTFVYSSRMTSSRTSVPFGPVQIFWN